MRVVEFDSFGSPDVLRIVETPMPRPARGEVLVRVEAAGINFFEVLMRQDRYAETPQLPMRPGVEAAGVVVAVGEAANPELLGARVAAPLFSMGRAGGYADFVVADADLVVRLPEAVSFADAAALMVQGLTALHLVRQSPPERRTVLVTAAAGGVGSLLVQLARGHGAQRVVAAAGSEEKRALALRLGADATVDSAGPLWAEAVRTAAGGVGADTAYDLVGGDATSALLDALAPEGELVFAALGRFGLKPAEMERLLALNQTVRGFALLPLLRADALGRDLLWLFGEAAAGRLTVTQGGRWPLEGVADAHRAIETRRTSGKVVLVP